MTGWLPIRPMPLLDLTDTWHVRQGASSSLDAAPHVVCRNWAREIRRQLSDQVVGILVSSTWTGRPNVVLFADAAPYFPGTPELSRPLTHPSLTTLIQRAAVELNWPAPR